MVKFPEGCDADVDMEFREKIEGIEGVLQKHDERIQKLEIQFAKSNTKLESIENTVADIKSTSIQNNNAVNSVLTLLNQIVVSSLNLQSQERVTKSSNKTELRKEIIKTIGVIVASAITSGLILHFF